MIEEEKVNQSSGDKSSDVSNELRWYVLRVQSGREEKAERLLNALKSKMSEIDSVVIPQEKVTEIKGGKRTLIEKKLYPGYIFIRMKLTDDVWYNIRQTEGLGLFMGMDKPMPLSEIDVSKVFNLIQKSDKEPTLNVTFQKGDTVRVKGGPFESFEGSVEELNIKKGMVKVSMVVFGRPTNVELEYWQLEKV
ncbi:MAG: transcription termination/antitermination factor NusG [Planctomycetes bacterium]|nr:transcription termination/antitermination factor NusG [Planctomycetota bacterium]